MIDVAIIGGSFAGLTAALQLGRASRSVAVIDAGAPRNRMSPATHVGCHQSLLFPDSFPALEASET